MNYSDNFSNYVGREKDLIGRYVLLNYNDTTRYIRKISSVSKKSFKIEDSEIKFNTVTGFKRITNTWTCVYCVLLTENEVQEEISKLELLKRCNNIKTKILSNIETLTPEQLLQIDSIISKIPQ